MRSSWRVSVTVGAALLLAGCHVGAGPVLGYAVGRGGTVGWEAGGGFALVRGNIGQSSRKGTAPLAAQAGAAAEGAQKRSDPETVTYVVAEPWLYAGGTLGLAHSDQAGLGVAAGVWEGLAGPIGGDDRGPRPYVSLAIGFRYLAGATEFYFAPKVGVVDTPEFSLGM